MKYAILAIFSACVSPGSPVGVANGPNSTGLVVQNTAVNVALFTTLETALADELDLYRADHPGFEEVTHQRAVIEGLTLALVQVREARAALEAGRPWQPTLRAGLDLVRAAATGEDRRWVLPLTTLAGLFLALLEGPQ